MSLRFGLSAAALICVPVALQAQDAINDPCVSCIPPLTPVDLVLDAELGSKISKTGDTFPLHLLNPIVVSGKELVPAGAKGVGEVIHAKKAGGSGAPGELVLAARYVTVGERQLRLRSMRVALSGKDAIHTVDAINAASAASPLPVGLIGFAISGRNIVLTTGTIAVAKTAELFAPEPVAPAHRSGGAETQDSRPEVGH